MNRAPKESDLEARLAASESRFHNIIEKNADGVLVVRRSNGTICYANPEATRLLHRTLERLQGEVFGIPIIPGGTTEVDLPLSDGRIRVAEMRVVETEWEGEPALLATLRDVSERKQLEEQLRLKAEQLAEADRRKNEFLAMLAHELRNPLAPIRNALHVLKIGSGDRSLRTRMCEIAQEQVSRLSRLVDDLLEVSRITRGKIRLRPELVSVSALISRSIEAVRPLLDARSHELRFQLPVLPIRIQGDPVRLEQIIVNLLTNAAKYTDAGGTIDLEVRVEGTELIVQVCDNGIGIAPEMLPRIFDLFTQADHTLDRSQGGLGIGLTLSRKLAELHGGSLTAHSDGLGRGSCFLLRVPFRASDCAFPPVAGPETAELRGHSPRRVLVVDNDTRCVQSLTSYLKTWGHEVRSASQVSEALGEARDSRPDLVLVNVDLPDVGGRRLASEFRELAPNREVRVVALVGDRLLPGKPGETNRFSDCDRLLVKPIDPLSLLPLLNHTAAAARSEPPRSSD
jgi:signal transduction histidine kinase